MWEVRGALVLAQAMKSMGNWGIRKQYSTLPLRAKKDSKMGMTEYIF